MANLIIGVLEDGRKCVYDVPPEIDTVEHMKDLIYDYNDNLSHREELQGQPKLRGFNGPMFNGYGKLKSTGEVVCLVRYERPSKY